MKMRNESTMYIFHNAYMDAEPMLEQKLTYTNHKEPQNKAIVLVCLQQRQVIILIIQNRLVLGGTVV